MYIFYLPLSHCPWISVVCLYKSSTPCVIWLARVASLPVIHFSTELLQVIASPAFVLLLLESWLPATHMIKPIVQRFLSSSVFYNVTVLQRQAVFTPSMFYWWLGPLNYQPAWVHSCMSKGYPQLSLFFFRNLNTLACNFLAFHVNSLMSLTFFHRIANHHSPNIWQPPVDHISYFVLL